MFYKDQMESRQTVLYLPPLTFKYFAFYMNNSQEQEICVILLWSPDLKKKEKKVIKLNQFAANFFYQTESK